MKIYFKNDGTYNEKAVGIPFTLNNIPIGYVCEVTPEYVTCEIWGKYITEERSIHFKNNEYIQELLTEIGFCNTPNSIKIQT